MKRSSVFIWIDTPNIFQILSLIQFHFKEAFNYSFDAEFHALQACVIGLEWIDFETVENSPRIRSSASLCIPTSDIFRVFSVIRFHCKEAFNNSFDAEFHALQACVIGLRRFDFETVKNSQIKRSSVLIWIRTPDIFPVFSLIEIHCKETFNESFDAEFYGVQACLIWLERFDFETVENSHRIRSRASLCIRTPNLSRIFSFIEIHFKEAFNNSFHAEFHPI